MNRERVALKGDIPSPIAPPTGCRFHTRCPWVTPACARDVLDWCELKPGHWVSACHCVVG